MDKQAEHELIRCAGHKTLTVRPASYRRERVLLHLIRDGYMIPRQRVNDPDFNPALLAGLAPGTSVTLTDKGRAWILALNPADFADVDWWPLPGDIRHAQEAVRNPGV